MKKGLIIPLIAGVVICVLPFILPTYGTMLVSELFIMSIFAMSLGLLMGYSGLISFGHAAFFGIGVYTVAFVSKMADNAYVIMIAALIICGLLALLTGILFIRTTGAYFIMLTLAFNQLVYVLFYKLKNITGGADGMSISATLDLGFGPLTETNETYYVMAVAFALCYLFLHLFIHSPSGKVIIGIKENEARMKALGYNIRYYKVLSYTIAGMMGGFAGTLYGYNNLFAAPESSSWMLSGQAMIMVIIGGEGTLIGGSLGAAVFVILQSLISSYTDHWTIIMGLIFMAVVLFARGGIAGIMKTVWKKLSGNRQPADEVHSRPLDSSLEN
jgi:branched-chain amino acid transport system permease protein